MKKEHSYFTEAYKYYTGKLYSWEDQGNPEEQDAYTRGLYHGFILAKKGQDELKGEITRNTECIADLADEINELRGLKYDTTRI